MSCYIKRLMGSKRAVGGGGGGREEKVRQTRADRDEEKGKKKHVKV